MKSQQSWFNPRRMAAGASLVALFGSTLVAGCRWHDGGLGAGGVAVEPGAPAPMAPPPNPGTPKPPAPTVDAGTGGLKDTGSSDAGSVTPTPANPPASDAGQATDTAPPPPPPPVSLPDAAAVDATPVPSTPPPAADTCVPMGGLQTSSIRLRFGRADDFTFDNDGRLLIFENRDIIRVGSSERDSLILVRNVGGVQGGTFRVLPDGDILLADWGRDLLVRIDPNGRRPDRNQMSIRSPLQMAAAPGSTTSFFVTSSEGMIFHADTVAAKVGPAMQLDFKAGGLAVDEARRKLYVGALGTHSVVAFDIGAQGELTGRTTVAEAVPQPTALAVDSCGGVFIAGDNGAIRRIGLQGNTTVIARLDARDITTLAFGTGKNGWAATSLFALDTYWGELHEIRIKR
jgi:hypothetical protein